MLSLLTTVPIPMDPEPTAIFEPPVVKASKVFEPTAILSVPDTSPVAIDSKPTAIFL